MKPIRYRLQRGVSCVYIHPFSSLIPHHSITLSFLPHLPPPPFFLALSFFLLSSPTSSVQLFPSLPSCHAQINPPPPSPPNLYFPSHPPPPSHTLTGNKQQASLLLLTPLGPVNKGSHQVSCKSKGDHHTMTCPYVVHACFSNCPPIVQSPRGFDLSGHGSGLDRFLVLL